MAVGQGERASRQHVGDGREEGPSLEQGRADDELGLIVLGQLGGIAGWINLFGFRRATLGDCGRALQGDLAARPVSIHLAMTTVLGSSRQRSYQSTLDHMPMNISARRGDSRHEISWRAPGYSNFIVIYR